MPEEHMLCNFKNCNVPLTKTAWVTRCGHVFCMEHGDPSFLNKLARVKCPVCGELKIRDADISLVDLNPPEMLISCVRPDRAIEFAANACKLWCYQMHMKQKLMLANLNNRRDQAISDSTSKLRAENNVLKRLLNGIEKRLKQINEELTITKQRLNKYKAAYESLASKQIVAVENENVQFENNPVPYVPDHPFSFDFGRNASSQDFSFRLF